MKAILHGRYGPPEVLRFEDVEKPTAGDNEVLVKVHAASVNAGDWHIMRGDPFLVRLMFGLTKPKNRMFGSDMAGRVEAVGQSVKQFQPGDEVFGDLTESGRGAFAEHVSVPESALVSKPSNLTFEEAAAVPMAAVTALQSLRDHGRIQSGQRVLITGASGGVGGFAVQIAKSFGAEVIGVCSTGKMDLVRSIGADRIIDHTQEDFTQSERDLDLILDCAAHRSVLQCRRALKRGGVYVMVGGPVSRFFQVMILGPLISLTGGVKAGTMMARPNREDLEFVKDLVEAGKVTPVIDRQFPLSETAEAIRYLESGKVRGKVVVVV